MTDERQARMGLMAAQEAGDVGLVRLVRERGAVEVWDYAHAGHGQTALSRRAAQIEVAQLEQRTVAVGARFLIPGDPEWPLALADLAWSDPVGGFGGEPLGLWVTGPAPLDRLGSGVAIVGARASTAYGEHVAADWANGIAETGRPVVSGGAFGIDACAHRGALAARGVTVAVMAGGLAQFYPPGNTALLRRVQETGAILSEYPPDWPPSRSRFLVRNRLIAALAQATVIVEGAVRSGAQNTVSWALTLQRPILAVPGPVTSAMSVTPHRLIRNGEAVLVSTVEEVLAALKPLDSAIPDYPREPSRALDTLTGEQRRVHEALPARRAMCVDELAVITGESTLSLLVSLAHLKQRGLVTETGSGLWRVVPPVREGP